MSLRKKAASLLLAGCIALSTVPAAAAVETARSLQVGATSGTLYNLTWNLDDSGTLIISGNGEMRTSGPPYHAPWYSNCDNIKKLSFNLELLALGGMLSSLAVI